MKKNLLMVVALLVALAAFGQARGQGSASVEDLSKPEGVEPPMLGIRWARGFNPNFLESRAKAHGTKPPHGTKTPSILMTSHGGDVLTSATTESIFWGASWANASFADKISGLDTWYQGYNNSHYSEASDEYSGLNGQVGPGTSYAGHVVDVTTGAGGNRPSVILSEVCKVISAPVSNGYYAVYTDRPRGGSSYCAYHSFGSCGGTQIDFAFYWNVDGDVLCDPEDTSGLHSQGLAALANLSGHELSEVRTDPTAGGWYDSSGAENGDKCAWTFNTPLVTFSNGSQWKIQGLWSNAAYNNGTGYPNAKGQDGCISGQ